MRAKKHSKPLPKKKCPPILALSPAIQRTSPSFHHHDVCSSNMSRWPKYQASTRSPSGERDASRNASSAFVGEARIHIHLLFCFGPAASLAHTHIHTKDNKEHTISSIPPRLPCFFVSSISSKCLIGNQASQNCVSSFLCFLSFGTALGTDKHALHP